MATVRHGIGIGQAPLACLHESAVGSTLCYSSSEFQVRRSRLGPALEKTFYSLRFICTHSAPKSWAWRRTNVLNHMGSSWSTGCHRWFEHWVARGRDQQPTVFKLNTHGVALERRLAHSSVFGLALGSTVLE